MHTFLLTLEPSSYKEEEFEPNRFMGSASVIVWPRLLLLLARFPASKLPLREVLAVAILLLTARCRCSPAIPASELARSPGGCSFAARPLSLPPICTNCMHGRRLVRQRNDIGQRLLFLGSAATANEAAPDALQITRVTTREFPAVAGFCLWFCRCRWPLACRLRSPTYFPAHLPTREFPAAAALRSACPSACVKPNDDDAVHKLTIFPPLGAPCWPLDTPLILGRRSAAWHSFARARSRQHG